MFTWSILCIIAKPLIEVSRLLNERLGVLSTAEISDHFPLRGLTTAVYDWETARTHATQQCKTGIEAKSFAGCGAK